MRERGRLYVRIQNKAKDAQAENTRTQRQQCSAAGVTLRRRDRLQGALILRQRRDNSGRATEQNDTERHFNGTQIMRKCKYIYSNVKQ